MDIQAHFGQQEAKKCSCFHVLINGLSSTTGNRHTLSIIPSSTYRRGRNLAQTPRVSLKTKRQHLPIQKTKLNMSCLCLGKKKKKSLFRRKSSQGNSEHWAPRVDTVVFPTIGSFPMFRLQAATKTLNSSTLQLKTRTLTFEKSCFCFTWQLLW